MRNFKIKRNLFLSRSGKKIIAVFLICTILFTLLPGISTDAATSKSQTQYKNITEFQKTRWGEIQNSVFGISSLVEDAAGLVELDIKENSYFKWSTAGNLIKWDGNNDVSIQLDSHQSSYQYNDVYTDGSNNMAADTSCSAEITYQVYDVGTPQEFRWILVQSVSEANNNTHIKINITNDLDFNAQKWIPVSNKTGEIRRDGSIYIEGNGHTLYNLKLYGPSGANTGLFGYLNKRLIVKNLGFKSTMLLANTTNAGLIYGSIGRSSANNANAMVYLYNVHSDGAYMQSTGKMGGLLGQSYVDGNTFIENCSTKNYYMYGKDHIAGIATYTQLATPERCPLVKYDARMPMTPEAFLYQSEIIFPVVIENSYSVDCELFSTGSDSGSFISCGQSLIVRNCFTNNTIYASYNTGGFIGRCAYPADSRPGKMYDDAGNRKIGNYFENCYSSGLVEGKSAMGGFTGLDNTYRGLENIYADPEGVTEASLTWFRFGSTANSKKAVADSTDAGSTVYKNCYSTAMVGMDYAGKYVGGFIGMDENYTWDTTVTINGDQIHANGSFYINCYAAGEVGNILTVTDKNDAAELEALYFANDEGRDVGDEILDYYPTGGFIGVISPDLYWYEKTTNSMAPFNGTLTYSNVTYVTVLPAELKNFAYGYFENCYYDMQTTAMHEMAVGMKNVNAYNDQYVEGKETFSLTGITGVYTENSDVKKMDGLTDFPGGPEQYAMDASGADSTVWNYETGYYPQLKVFMQFDLDGNGNLVTSEQQAGVPFSNSPFYVPVTSENMSDGSESHEVSSFDSVSEIVTAYRYSQASTSTVLLNHWDYRMNTADGALSTDNDWRCAVGENKLIYNQDTQFWEKQYTGLAAGQYAFKIQADGTMTYNYGSDRFDGQNCILEVPQDNCNVRIRFKYKGLRSGNYQIYADIYDENSNPIGENLLLGGKTEEVIKEVWTVVGSFPFSSWDVTNTEYDMDLSDNDGDLYTLTQYLEPDKDENNNYIATTFQFKIARDHSWNESYGVGGKSDNMGFTLTAPCKVTFTFNNKTHITTVAGNPAESIKDIATEDRLSFEFEGYSVIGPSDLTGFDWLQSGQEKAAAEKGKMTEIPEGSGVYTLTLDQVKMGRNYAYKIIKDAVDEGANSYFYLEPHTEDENGVCSVTFTYDSHTGQTTIHANIQGSDREFAQPTIAAQYFTVLGAEGLTGYHWLGDGDHPAPPQTEETKEQYRLDAIANGRMEVVPGTSLYRKIFQNIAAGTYGFKVAADGSLDLSYGANDSNENYNITLKETADVEITFNKDKGTISVKTNPSGALDEKVYVVTGTENLMGKTWDLNDAVMTYNEEEGVYEYIRTEVSSGSNYAFKVIEKGVDSGDNISFYLNGDKAKYNIRFTYNPKNGVITKQAFDIEDGTDMTDSAIKDVRITTYSVLGEKGLTGSNWLGLTDSGRPGTKEAQLKASEDGAMALNSDGTYTKVYHNILVGTDGEMAHYSFKVAANGNWDSGISYGDGAGGNYVLILNGDQSKVTVCDVTIHFDPDTGKITAETTPSDCNLTAVDDSKFSWYVVGDYQLVSYDEFRAPNTVYDTVRDITSNFEFTSGRGSSERGVAWSINDERNGISGFFESLGGGSGFSLDYQVDGKDTTTGTFATPVVDLGVDVVGDSYQGARPDDNIARYYCDEFMPGKQWLSVSALGLGYSGDYVSWKNAYLQYVNYLRDLEKFSDAAGMYYKILGDQLPEKTPSALVRYMTGLRDSGDSNKVGYYNDLVSDYGDILQCYETIQNQVENPGDAPEVKDQKVVGTRYLRLIPTVYLEAGNDAKVNVFQDSRDESGTDAKNIVRYDDNASSDVRFTGIQDRGYSYYNFAFTAGYAVTDKIGLGIYDNYNRQKIVLYGEGIRDHDETAERNPDTYFAMTSVFTENPAYTDQPDKGLIADSLVKQSIIGNSYDYNSKTNADPEKKEYGQTIVKIYKVDESGNNAKVFMDANGSQNSLEYKNYQKWTGQRAFTAEDKGLYKVVFYWALSDGRYLTDSKLVTITTLQPGITKSVDKVYDESGDTNTLTYSITYTNSDKDTPVDFAILDVLPYAGDIRYNDGDKTAGDLSTKTTKDVSFDIQSLKISQSGAATIKGVYYSQNTEHVRRYLFDETDTEKPSINAAEKLGVDGNGKIDNTNQYWTDITRQDVGGGGTYTPENARNITAVAVSGVQLGVSESITIEMTLSYQGSVNDLYVNNAFYYARSNEEAGINGYADPVTTVLVDRDINGYVWLDKDIDGFVDEDEARIGNVKVSLCQKQENGEYVTVQFMITGEDGYYTFTNLLSGTYEIVFSEGESNPVIYDGTPGGRKDKKFSDLELTKKLIEANVTNVIGSRNIAGVYETDGAHPSSYSIPNQLPRPEEIYRQTFANTTNVTLDGFHYTKNFQNIGLTDSNGSITIKKKGEDDQSLNGVVFKLEYLDEETGKWLPVSYDENGYVIRDESEEGAGRSEFTTGDTMPDGSKADGVVVFSNLFEARYRITEVSTVLGYNLLASSIEVDLPYKVKADTSDTGNILSVNCPSEPDYTKDGYNYYRDITFTISNTTNLNVYLPLTGAGTWSWIIFVGIALVLTGTGIFFYLSKKKKKVR